MPRLWEAPINMDMDVFTGKIPMFKFFLLRNGKDIVEEWNEARCGRAVIRAGVIIWAVNSCSGYALQFLFIWQSRVRYFYHMALYGKVFWNKVSYVVYMLFFGMIVWYSWVWWYGIMWAGTSWSARPSHDPTVITNYWPRPKINEPSSSS